MQKSMLVAAFLLPLLVLIPVSAYAQAQSPPIGLLFPTGMTISDDGTVVYIVDNTGIARLDLSSAFDITSATVNPRVGIPSATAVDVQAAAISNAGNRIFLGTSTFTAPEVVQVPVRLDGSIATPSSPPNCCEFRTSGMTISRDGMWLITGGDGNGIASYELGNAFDIANDVTQNSTSAQPASFHGVSISNDGTSLFTIFGSTVNQYALSTPYVVSSINTTPVDTFDIGISGFTARDIDFSSDGRNMYVLDTGNDLIYQYTFADPFTLFIAPPTPTITANDGTNDLANGVATSSNSLTFTVQFSEDVTGFADTDIVLSGTADSGNPRIVAGSFTEVNAAQYTFEVIQGFNVGTVIVSIDAGAARSVSGGIDSLAAFPFTAIIGPDNTPPTVTISSTQVTESSTTRLVTANFTATFSEPIMESTFTAGDIDASGDSSLHTAMNIERVNDITYNFQIVHSAADQNISIFVRGNSFDDVNGNANEGASESFQYDFANPPDNTPPTVTISSTQVTESTVTNLVTANFTATFSEPIMESTFTAGDISASGDSSSHSVMNIERENDITYDFQIVHSAADQNISIFVLSGSFEDVNGNANAAASESFQYDFANAPVTPPAGTMPPVIILPIIQSQYVINEELSLQFGQVSGRPAAEFTFPGRPQLAAITNTGAFSWTPNAAGTFSFNVTATNTGGSDTEPIILRVVNSITPFVAGELVPDDIFDRPFGDAPAGIQFSNDGLHMFVLESSENDITRYTTITPFDFANTTSDINSDITRDFESSVPMSVLATDLEFSNDGRTMILMDLFSGLFYEYALDAPYVLDPRTQVNTHTPANLVGAPNGFTISSDGTKLFIVEGTTPVSSRVHEHTLAIPFSVSDVTYDRSLNLGSNPATPQDVAFYNSTAMLIVGPDGALHEYAVDSSSISYSGISQTIPTVGPSSMAVADNGLHLFVLDDTMDDIFRYSVVSGSFTTEIDSNPPGATAADGIASFNVEFGRSVTGFDLSDITISSVAPDGTALSAGTHVPSNLTGSGAEYAFDVLRGADDATITVSIPANAVGGNEASNAYSIDLSLNVMIDYTSSSSITRSFSMSADIDFSGNGDAIFITNDNGNQIHRYALSTNFNSSTAATTIGPVYTITQDTSPRALEFSTNGLKMFVLGQVAREILEYDLSGAFDITNPTYLDDNLDISVAVTGAQGIEFSRDGTHLYVIDSGGGGGHIYDFPLDVAFDVSSGDANDFVTSAILQEFQRSLAINDDGTVMYVLAARDLYAYTFGVAYDVSTLSLEATQPLGTANSAQGLAFSTDLTTMSFVRNDPSNTVHEFTLNAIPVLGIPTFSFFEEGNDVSGLAIPASDPDGDTLEYRLSNHPGWLSIDSATGDLSGVVPQDNSPDFRNTDTPARCFDTGSVSFTVTVSDDGFDGNDADDVSRDYTVTINNQQRLANTVPVVAGGTGVPLATTAEQLDLSLYTVDADTEDTLTYFLVSATGDPVVPDSATLDVDTGLLAFTPTGDAGPATIMYRACDGSNEVPLTVTTNTAAVIMGISDQTINEGQTLDSLNLNIISDTASPLFNVTQISIEGDIVPIFAKNSSISISQEPLPGLLPGDPDLNGTSSGGGSLSPDDLQRAFLISSIEELGNNDPRLDERIEEELRQLDEGVPFDEVIDPRIIIHTIPDDFVDAGLAQSPPATISYTYVLENGNVFSGVFDLVVNRIDDAPTSMLPASYVVDPLDANTLVFLDTLFEDSEGDDIVYNVTNPDPGIVDLSILSSSNVLIIDPVSPGIVAARLCAESIAPGITNAVTCETIPVIVRGIETTESGIFQDSSVNVRHGLLDADVVLNWDDFAIDPTVAFNHIIITADNADATGEIRINQTDRATLVPVLTSDGTTVHTRIFPSNGSGSISYDPTSDFTSTSDSVTFTAVLHGPSIIPSTGVVIGDVIPLVHDSLTVNYIIVTVNTDAAPGPLQGDLAFGPRHTSDRFAIPLDDLFVDNDNSRPRLDVAIMTQSNQALTANIVGDLLIITPPGPNCNCQTLFTFALDDGVNPPQPEQLLFRFESDPAGTVPVGFPQSPVGRFFLPPGFEPFFINLADQVVRGDAAFAENVVISNVQLPDDGNGVRDNSHITATMHNATHYQIAPGTNDLVGFEIITFDVGFVEDPVNANVFTSYRFEFADAPETAQQQVSSGGGDDDTQWKTKPTFGKSYTTGQKIVDCGYSMDNVCRDVTDYHVDYKRNTIETDSLHDFTLTAYAQNGLRSFNIGFGLPGIGSPLNAAEAQINVNLIRDYSLDSTYMIDSVEYSNENRVIGEDATFEISRVQCLPADNNELCVRLSIDGVLFRETLYDEPFAINALDSKRRGTTHYMNEGLLVYGDSLNAPPTHELSERHSNQGDAVKLHLTRTDKLADVWTDQLGHQWTKNAFGTWSYVDAPPVDMSSACTDEDNRACDAFAQKRDAHIIQLEELRDSVYGGAYVTSHDGQQ